jgi:hypothetical protein
MKEQTPKRHAGLTGEFASLEEYMEFYKKSHQASTPRGEKHKNSKLSYIQVLEIRKKYRGGENAQELGKIYGISSSSVENIVNGATWGHIEGEKIDPEQLAAIKRARKLESQTKATKAMTKLTEADVRAIRAEYVPGKVRMKDLGARYGITQPTVSDIINRKIWTHI